MASKFITVPQQSRQLAEEELKAFLRSHRVLSVERRWVDEGENSFWAFCVAYLESSSAPAPAGRQRDNLGRNKVDYREVLKPEEFAVFARLRELRKPVAQAVPVDTVFTNEPLARIVQTRATSKAALEPIAGVGNARIETYGLRVMRWLLEHESRTSIGEEAGFTPETWPARGARRSTC